MGGTAATKAYAIVTKGILSNGQKPVWTIGYNGEGEEIYGNVINEPR